VGRANTNCLLGSHHAMFDIIRSRTEMMKMLSYLLCDTHKVHNYINGDSH